MSIVLETASSEKDFKRGTEERRGAKEEKLMEVIRGKRPCLGNVCYLGLHHPLEKVAEEKCQKEAEVRKKPKRKHSTNGRFRG